MTAVLCNVCHARVVSRRSCLRKRGVEPHKMFRGFLFFVGGWGGSEVGGGWLRQCNSNQAQSTGICSIFVPLSIRRCKRMFGAAGTGRAVTSPLRTCPQHWNVSVFAIYEKTYCR